MQTVSADITKPCPGDIITVVLPEPPSANVYYRRGFKGAPHESGEAKAYKEAISMLTSRDRHGAECAFPSGDVSITVLWHRSAKRGDLDNRLKILLDALAGLLFRNDKQVAEIRAQRVDQHATLQRGFMRVEISRLQL